MVHCGMERADVRSWLMTIATVVVAVAALMTLLILVFDGRYVETSDVPNIRKGVAADVQKGDDGVREEMERLHEQIGNRIDGNGESIRQLNDRLIAAGG